MKISVDPKYPGYSEHAYMLSSYLEVYLNGKKLTDCIAADSDAGIAWCYKHHKDGSIVVKTNADGNPECEVEQRRGNVCIFVPDEYKHLL